ncbi:hypothetical protein SAMN05421823_101682 [Catalinimonas alkaloidigena]|uniref:Uncharacterized protein n=1 Tax=Catalinimonas alkaloidigena TaxID=1075417 RepID=A0A1G8YI84_9BACT|nr:hypothetical protein SAMN05421823_101682 [Catalinimonas alkaloidigena]
MILFVISQLVRTAERTQGSQHFCRTIQIRTAPPSNSGTVMVKFSG